MVKAQQTETTPVLKKNKSAYMFFCAEERAVVLKELPSLGNKEILSELGRRWKSLVASQSNKDKSRLEKLNKLAEEDKARYQQDKLVLPPKEKAPKKVRSKKVKEQAEEVSSEEEVVVETPVEEKPTKTKGKSKSKTKKEVEEAPQPVPVSAPVATKVNGYVMYAKKHRAEVKAELGEVPAQEVTKELGRRWKALSAEEQETYKH